MVNLNNNKLGSWAKGSLKRSVELANQSTIPCQIRGLMCASVFMKRSIEHSLDRKNIVEPELTPFGNHFLRLGPNRKRRILDKPALVKLPTELLIKILEMIVGDDYLKKRVELKLSLGFGY